MKIETTGDVSMPDGKFSVIQTAANHIASFRGHHATSPYGLEVFWPTPQSGHGTYGFNFQDANDILFRIWDDGDAVNKDNSYGSSSDLRLKQDITDANSQWDDIKDIRVVNFRRKQDVKLHGEDAPYHIGTIAQEVELVSAGLISDYTPSEFELEEYGMVEGDKIKGMKYSVLYMKAIKALQECMSRIEALENE